MASASMKLPMNRKMIGSANERQRAPGRRHLEDHRQRRAEQRRHGHRQRLAHPQHDDRRHHRGEAVPGVREPGHRQQQDQQQRRRRQEGGRRCGDAG
mgnify:CR=1 FL=1